MPSLRHNGPDDALLDAARACLVAVGWRRTTLTDVARRAGVSRMTIYRRWPDMQTLLADLMTREWSTVVEPPDVHDGAALARITGSVAATTAALRGNDLFRAIVAIDPEVLLPYLLDRPGRAQAALLSGLEAAVRAGQRDGSVRAGDPRRLSRSVLLAAHGFVLSAATMTTPDGPSLDDLDAELAELVRRYLAA